VTHAAKKNAFVDEENTVDCSAGFVPSFNLQIVSAFNTYFHRRLEKRKARRDSGRS